MACVPTLGSQRRLAVQQPNPQTPAQAYLASLPPAVLHSCLQVTCNFFSALVMSTVHNMTNPAEFYGEQLLYLDCMPPASSMQHAACALHELHELQLLDC